MVITSANKAPAGYGLGEGANRVDWNTATKNGFYSGSINSPNGNTFAGFAYTDPSFGLMQVASGFKGGICCTAQRYMYNGEFEPWEWITPPMQLGVEYRTTERYLGKPVYVRLHDFGALPNNTFKEDHSPESWSIDKAICAYGTTSEGITIPTQNYAGQVTTGRHVSVYFMHTEVTVATDADRTYASATLFLKYTKTTD